MTGESSENKSRTRKLLKVAALGATAMAALSCGGKTDEPVNHGSTTQDGGGGVGRSTEDASVGTSPCAANSPSCGPVGSVGEVDAGTTSDDAGFIGKTFDDAGPVGSAPVEAGVGRAADDGGADQDGSG